jgi:hypothetical protein
MATNTEYEALIALHQYDDLLRLWERVAQAESTPGWEAGRALEYLIVRAFELEGAEVRYPYSVNISNSPAEQIDGVIYSDGISYMIECKDTATRENIESIAKLRNQLLRRPAQTMGLVFSRSGFTPVAITLTQYSSPQNILLWNGAEINDALRSGMMRELLKLKFRACVETGQVDWNPKGESEQ